MSGYHVALTNS